jgi:hypothetical protein
VLIAAGVKTSGGEGGIRTLGTGVSPYNGLANRRIRPLCHLSGVWSFSLPRLNSAFAAPLRRRQMSLPCLPGTSHVMCGLSTELKSKWLASQSSTSLHDRIVDSFRGSDNVGHRFQTRPEPAKVFTFCFLEFRADWL